MTRLRYIDWKKVSESMEFTCPFCGGEGCDGCVHGIITPTMSKYQLPLHIEVTDEKKHISLGCGLVIYMYDGESYMAPINPETTTNDIIRAYRLLTRSVPYKWAMRWYHGDEGEEEVLDAEACFAALYDERLEINRKIEEIKVMLRMAAMKDDI